MFIIDTSSHSDSLNKKTKQNNFTLIPKWVGGQDKLAWTAYPPTLQLSIQNNLTKKTAEFDLNYVYN